jgi:hypothetical protein
MMAPAGQVFGREHPLRHHPHLLGSHATAHPAVRTLFLPLDFWCPQTSQHGTVILPSWCFALPSQYGAASTLAAVHAPACMHITSLCIPFMQSTVVFMAQRDYECPCLYCLNYLQLQCFGCTHGVPCLPRALMHPECTPCSSALLLAYQLTGVHLHVLFWQTHNSQANANPGHLDTVVR